MKISSFFHLSFLYGTRSYSQEGEDMYLLKLFNGKRNGFFVDVGAHHPYRYSNTFALYQQGWRGINIDAAPGSMQAFARTRKRDINLEMVIGDEGEHINFYVFEESALNTASKKVADRVVDTKQSKLINTIKVDSNSLKQVLDEYMPNQVSIDLLTIDVEGNDVEVLKSNDWDKYQPTVVIVEEVGLVSVQKALKADVSRFLDAHGYLLRDKIGNSLIYKKAE